MADAHQQRAATADQACGEAGKLAMGDVFQGLDELQRLAGGLHGERIATDLALRADAGGDPPDARVVEQERLNDALEEIDPQVVAADVGQFVGNDGLEHVHGHAGDE